MLRNKIIKIHIFYSGGSFEHLINSINKILTIFCCVKGNAAGIFSRQIVQKGLSNTHTHIYIYIE